MIKWFLKLLSYTGRVGITSRRELSKHRLHTVKSNGGFRYEDLCM
jgi:hypothetical protein